MSGSGLSYEILLACPEGLKKSAVCADLSPRFDAICTGDIEDRIVKEWERRCLENPKLYNGSKFRLASVRRKRAESRERSTQQGETSPAEGPQISVQLGLTDYRSFTGTNLHVGWQHLVIEDDAPTPPKNKQTFRTRNRASGNPDVFVTIWEGMGMPGRHLANGLGNAAVVETADGGVVLLKRSGQVGEFPFAIVLPGGHPEPSKLGLDSIGTWKRVVGEGPDGVPRSAEVMDELFSSISAEVHEETGIPLDSLLEPVLLGFTRRVENHRPCMVFKVATTLQRAEVEAAYRSEGVQDRFESTGLYTLSASELITEVQRCDAGVPGDHVGGVKLYEAHLALQT